MVLFGIPTLCSPKGSNRVQGRIGGPECNSEFRHAKLEFRPPSELDSSAMPVLDGSPVRIDRIQQILDDGRAERYLREYFAPRVTIPNAAGKVAYSGYIGSRFERFAGGGDRPEAADYFTADDIVAVSTLSVRIPGSAAIELLETQRSDFREMLRLIPTNVDLADVSPEDIGPDWPAWMLWEELMKLAHVDWVTASKLLARKRPRLLPVYDRVVRAYVAPQGSYWRALNSALRVDDAALHRELLSVRARSGVGEDISVLRVFDVIAWRAGRDAAGAPDEISLRSEVAIPDRPGSSAQSASYHPSANGTVPADSAHLSEVEIYAEYEGRRTYARFSPRAKSIQITSGELTGEMFSSPTSAAAAVITHQKPGVSPSRNGWTFWLINDSTGDPLQTIRHRQG